MNLTKQTLPELEAIIAKGKQAFVEVGLALLKIKIGELWGDDYRTFEHYCEEKWGFKKSYAYELIQGAKVVASLPDELSTIVENPGQMREVAKVKPEKRAKVLEEVTKRGPVTAKAIHDVAEELDETVADERPQVHAGPARPDTSEVVSELDVVMEDIKSLLNKILTQNFDKADLISVAVELKKAARKIETVAATA